MSHYGQNRSCIYSHLQEQEYQDTYRGISPQNILYYCQHNEYIYDAPHLFHTLLCNCPYIVLIHNIYQLIDMYNIDYLHQIIPHIFQHIYPCLSIVYELYSRYILASLHLWLSLYDSQKHMYLLHSKDLLSRCSNNRYYLHHVIDIHCIHLHILH